MKLTQRIFAQALMLAGVLEPEKEALLRLLCTAASADMQNRLRQGMRPEGCEEAFVAAASLYALASLSQTDEASNCAAFTVGDVTVRPGDGNAARCLKEQAERIIAPYSADRFTFLGV